MRILYFSERFSTHDDRFLRAILRGSHTPYYLRLFEEGDTATKGRLPREVRLVRFPTPPTREGLDSAIMDAVFQLDEILGSVKPDLVHAGPVDTCGFLTAVSGFHPYVLMSWGSDILLRAGRDQHSREVARYAIGRCDALLHDCQAVRKEAKKIARIGDRKTLLLPWGTDIDRFVLRTAVSPLRESLGWEHNMVLICTRSWEQIYAIDILLEAFKRVFAGNPNVRLLLVGGGSMASWIDDFIGTNGLDQVIHMPGRVEHEMLPTYFQSADLYVNCSRQDGTSVSMLEAFATGLPVVVSDLASNREWVRPGTNGWLAAVDDPESFADAVRKAGALPAARLKRMSRRNRSLAVSRANWRKNVGKLLRLYSRLHSSPA